VLAAGTLFEERGYGGTSLSEVAAAAGVARPTVEPDFTTWLAARMQDALLDG